MAGFKRPSFLKRQKEQKRLAKQAAKREARAERKSTPLEEQDLVPLESVIGELAEESPPKASAEDEANSESRR